MYKFKFDPPQEHRRSLQQPKSQHVAILNLLDKCTQILREDRLWLRNQIKNNNSEVLDFFKQLPRTSQLQNLQIKLRKYVQAVKSKIKQEQLLKFKETLYQQHHPYHEPPKIEERNHQNLRTNHHTRTHQSNSKSSFKANSSVELNRTAQCRMGRSQDHHQINHMQMSSSLRHFQDLLKYKYNQDIIQERQSQNVTSARQARQECEQTQSHPLQQQNYSSIQNRNTSSTANLKPLNNKQNIIDHFSKSCQPSYDFRNKVQNRFTHGQTQSNPWQIQTKNKPNLYDFKSREQIKQKEIQEINIGFASRIDHEDNHEDREQSIFDKHFNESDKNSAKNEQKDYNDHGNQLIDEFRSNNYSKQTKSNPKTDKYIPQNSRNLNNQKPSYQLVQSEFSKISDKSNNNKSQIQSDRKSDQNLFTPLDLLNQCRNFLKNRDNSSKKIGGFNNFFDSVKMEDTPQIKNIDKKQEEHSECLFGRNHVQHLAQSKIKEKKQDNEEKQSLMPQPPVAVKQTLQTNKKEDNSFHYQHFQTFANASNTKKQFEKAISPPQIARLSKALPIKQSNQFYPADLRIEDILQSLMEITEMNPFIPTQDLTQFINSHKHHLFLNYSLNTLLNQDNKTEICLTSIAEKINSSYSKQNGIQYPHKDQTVNSVYELLDIELKGYINRQDIDSFLRQIEQADIQNFEQVCDELMRLFDGADFTNEERLTYWHLYLVKNSQQFERVSQLLSEFQFEIQRQN